MAHVERVLLAVEGGTEENIQRLRRGVYSHILTSRRSHPTCLLVNANEMEAYTDWRDKNLIPGIRLSDSLRHNAEIRQYGAPAMLGLVHIGLYITCWTTREEVISKLIEFSQNQIHHLGKGFRIILAHKERVPISSTDFSLGVPLTLVRFDPDKPVFKLGEAIRHAISGV